MDPWRAAVLGLVQGAGEFLPISSSGHLVVVPWLLGWPPHGLAFDVALHAGTLVAVLAAFSSEWLRIFRSAADGVRQRRPLQSEGVRLLLLLAVASIPAGVAGLLLEERAETGFRDPRLVAVAMGVMGVVLYLADRRQPREPGAEPGGILQVSWRDGLIIGAAQAFALVPGVSRSGATISMALFLGFSRERAAAFSFLLATPITAAAAVLKLPTLFAGADIFGTVVGMTAAAISGAASIRLLLGYVRTHDYRPFAAYRVGFAVFVLIVAAVRGA